LDYGDGKMILRAGKEAVKVLKSKPMEQQIVTPSAVFIFSMKCLTDVVPGQEYA
jgi:hypothetical protein